MTFIEACWAGEAVVEDIDNWVSKWHGGEGWSLSLAQYLGMSAEQYARWVRSPMCLQSIIEESEPTAP